MNIKKQILFKLIEEIPECDAEEVEDFIKYLNSKREKKLGKEIFKDLEQASESSLNFWNNNIDDEVWNNV